MSRQIVGALVLAGAAAAGLGAQAGDPPAVRALLDEARRAAGTEWGEAVEFICAVDPDRANRADDPLVAPTRVFDDLYAIGRSSTMVWALTTADGIVLVDAGYADQVETVLLPGLRSLGLDPARVTHVLLGHGHADHFGGAAYFQDRGARVVLSAADWDLLERPAAPPPAGAPAVRAPRRDLVAVDGQTLDVGGVRFTPVQIPGHTPGSLGWVFPVRDGGRPHTAALFGGSILIPGRIPDEGLRQYIASIEHFADVTRRLGADVELQNHPLYDGLLPKLRRLAARTPGGPHPFVVGPEGYQRFLEVMRVCTRVQLARRRSG